MESQLFQCDVVIGSEAVGGVGFTPVPAAHGSPASNSSQHDVEKVGVDNI